MSSSMGQLELCDLPSLPGDLPGLLGVGLEPVLGPGRPIWKGPQRPVPVPRARSWAPYRGTFFFHTLHWHENGTSAGIRRAPRCLYSRELSLCPQRHYCGVGRLGWNPEASEGKGKEVLTRRELPQARGPLPPRLPGPCQAGLSLVGLRAAQNPAQTILTSSSPQ